MECSILKINIFTYVYWPEQFLINELAEAFSQQGISVSVLTGLPNYPKGDFYPGYSIIKGPYSEMVSRVRIIRYPMHSRKSGFINLSINYITHLLSALVAQIKLPNADWAFVFATSPITTAIPAIVWAKLNNAKVCVWLQDLWPDSVSAVGAINKKSVSYRILGYMVRWIYGHVDLMLIQSPGFKNNLIEFGYMGPVVIAPNWAPDVEFHDPKIPDWFKINDECIHITFAGNIGVAQGIDTIILAARGLISEESIHFHIVGDGSDLQRIKNETKDLKQVHFYGRKPVIDMPGLFKKSTALLVALKSDPIFENTIPSKIQAYMASAKPIIAAIDGVGAKVIDDSGSGLVGPAENVEKLIQNILKIRSMSIEERELMGKKARLHYDQNYTKTVTIRLIETTLDQNTETDHSR